MGQGGWLGVMLVGVGPFGVGARGRRRSVLGLFSSFQ